MERKNVAAPAGGGISALPQVARRGILPGMKSLIILGSGPAGLTAAIYAARAGLAPLVLDGPAPGGPLVTTPLIENYPGFPDGIPGFELMEIMRKQAERFGARFQGAEVVRFAPAAGGGADLSLADGAALRADALIIATGAGHWASPAKTNWPATACPTAPRATARSTAGSPSPSSAAATRPWKKRSS